MLALAEGIVDIAADHADDLIAALEQELGEK
jgi:hypothetical protein